MTGDMEDQNSWNEMVFRQIRARKEWLVDLIWRKQLEHESDTNDVGIKDREVMNNHGDDLDNPAFTAWCDERKENFNAARGEHTPEVDLINSVRENRTPDNVTRENHNSGTMRISSTGENHTSEVDQINSVRANRTPDNVTRKNHISGTTKPGSTRGNHTPEVDQINSVRKNRTPDNVTREDHNSGTMRISSTRGNHISGGHSPQIDTEPYLVTSKSGISNPLF